MKAKSLVFALAVLVAGMLVGIARGEEPPKMASTATLGLAGGSLKLEGTSTLHPWSASTKDLRGSFRLKADAPAGDVASLVRSGAVESFELSIPVQSLKSGEGGLDDNMYKALKAEKNPSIVFRMSSYQVTPGAGGALKATLNGQLRVAGVARPVAIDLDAQPTAHGLRVTGSKVLSMKDFDVKAPVLMLGMIKTGDTVTVRFDVEIAAAAGAKG